MWCVCHTSPCDLAVTIETVTYSNKYINNIKINKPVILLNTAVRAACIENDQSELQIQQTQLTCQKLFICILESFPDIKVWLTVHYLFLHNLLTCL